MELTQLNFRMERREGLYFVTCPQIPGLLAAEHTIPAAMESAAKGIRDLALYIALEMAAGNPVKPIFRDVS